MNKKYNGYAIDLKGKRFGRLFVVERDMEQQQKLNSPQACWKCKCDCGSVIIVKSGNLIKGKTKSCGCLRDELGNKPFLYSIGQVITTKYGSLTVTQTNRIKREGSDIKDKVYTCICNNCGEVNKIKESTIQTGVGSCKACSESRSSGEKFMYWFLKQCSIDFNVEFSPWWAGRYRYDFEFQKDNRKYLIEIDGGQHYGKNYFSERRKKSRAEVDADKDQLAKRNGYQLIRIRCEHSNRMFMVDEIKKSILADMFDLSIIDWGQCYYMSLTKKSKKICDLWNDGYKSAKEISILAPTSSGNASKVLVQCSKFGLCDYDSKKEKERGQKRNDKAGKVVICLDNNMRFKSASECSRQSEEVFGVHLTQGGISRVCRGERDAYKGFHFKFL